MSRTLRLGLAALLSPALFQAGLAQDSPIYFEQFSQGSFVTYEVTERHFPKSLQTRKFEGKSGELYVFATYEGSFPGNAPLTTSYYDANGNMVKLIRSDGVELDFEPHDCSRVAGKCSYTLTFSNQDSENNYTRESSIGDNFIIFTLFGKRGNMLRHGSITLNEFGMISSRNEKSVTGNTVNFTTLRAEYK